MYILIKEINSKKTANWVKFQKGCPDSAPREDYSSILAYWLYTSYACLHIFIVTVFIILHKYFTVLILKFNRVT